jgi:hypothetical protein
MSPFSRELKFPGVDLRPDGTIDFTLTAEEAREADSALSEFAGQVVHPDYADRIRNGTIAVALSHYARGLVQSHLSEIAAANGKLPGTLQTVLAKAIAAVWKSSSLCPLPIFTFHRASFLRMLGREDEAKRLFASFIAQQTAFRPDQVDEHLMTYEGFDIKQALACAAEPHPTSS